MVLKVVDFSAQCDTWEARRLADVPERVVAGDPQHRSVGRFSNPSGDLIAGTWTSTPGKWHAFTDRDEFCTILSGHVRLIAEDGSAQEFRAGDSFLIPNGFRGFWEVVETTTKHYVIRDYS